MPQLLIVNLLLVDEAYLRTYISENNLYFNYKTSNSFYAFTFFIYTLVFAFIFSLHTMIIFVFLHGSHIGFYNHTTDHEVRSTIATLLFLKPAGTGSTRSIQLHACISHVSRCRETTYNLTPRCVVRQISPPAIMTPFLDVDRQSKPRLSRP